MAETSIAERPVAATSAPQLEGLERLAALMDTAYRIPVVNYRIGLDGLIGLIPGVGDAVTLIGFRARDHSERHMKAARVIVNDTTYDVYPTHVPDI